MYLSNDDDFLDVFRQFMLHPVISFTLSRIDPVFTKEVKPGETSEELKYPNTAAMLGELDNKFKFLRELEGVEDFEDGPSPSFYRRPL